MTTTGDALASLTSRQFALDSGWIAAEVSGSTTGHLVIGIPGLSANLRSYDVVFNHLDHDRFQLLAYDPRGRGRSSKTPEGTYGWPAHAQDVIDMADELGRETFDLVGWSFGTWVAMKVCELAPGRVRRLALIDGGGIPEERALVPIYAGLEKLGTVFPSREDFLQRVRAVGFYEPWEPWQGLFEYEIEDVDGGGVRPRTRADACWEDERWRKAHDSYALWEHVTMPSLLVRASRPIPPAFGHILSQSDAARFQQTVPGTRVVEVDAHHYTVGMHRDTARYIAAFLERE